MFSESNHEPVVTIMLKNLHQYRLPFYERLEQKLSQKGIHLRLVMGGGLPEDEAKGDRAALPWAETRDFRSISLAGRTLLWQSGFDVARDSDLIITEQASKQLFNLVLSFGQRRFGTRHAFWGHGRNFQSSVEGTAGEGLKRLMTRRAHWFFSYNDLSTAAAVDFGMNPERVTAVMNSTDTTSIRNVRRGLDSQIEAQIRAELQMGSGPVALYLGGVYEHKRPQFVIDAAEHIRSLIPDFEMLVIGDGSAGPLMTEAAKRHSWFHHLGACYGDERIALASIASVQLMPGLVGLNIVDAFALGIPTVTTNIDYHSPEIEYMVDGVNGLITSENATPEDFGSTVADLLSDPDRLEAMSFSAELASYEFSIEDMTERFADGIVQALL